MSNPGEVQLTIQEEGTKQQPAAAAAGDGPNLAPSDACPSEFLKDKKKFEPIFGLESVVHGGPLQYVL